MDFCEPLRELLPGLAAWREAPSYVEGRKDEIKTESACLDLQIKSCIAVPMAYGTRGPQSEAVRTDAIPDS